MSSPPLFEILDETPDFLVINKPGNLVCHPTKGDAFSSLIGRLRLHFQDQPEVRPSFVNRLDRETSGIVLIAKRREVHARLQRAWENERAEKIYLAVVHGVPAEPEGTLDAPLGRDPREIVRIAQAVTPGGAPSRTDWRLLRAFEDFSLLEVRPRTGRLHQIRVHLAWMGHPVVGDKLYGPDPRLYLEFIQTGWTPALEARLLSPRQLLHAASLRLRSANDGGEWNWKCPPPADLQTFLARLTPEKRPWRTSLAP